MSEQLRRQLEDLPDLGTAHLQITLLALVIAMAISVPIGIAATRVRWLEQLSLGVAGVVQTIPGLALLAVMVPLLSALGLSGIGFVPALLGLSLYCVLPILFGTVTGIREVDPAMVEAARGVGMTPGQRLRMVELPLALPVIVAGLRTSTVWCVGMATLSTPVGAPSLGNYIFAGLQTRNYVAVMVGCVAAAVLAQVLDRLVQALEIGFRRRRRRLVLGASAALSVLFLYAGGSFAAEAIAERGEDRVVIGAKTFTEQLILGELLSQRIVGRTERPAEVLPSLGSTVAFDALRNGEIDLYVEYSGTIWATIMRRSDVPEDRGDVLDAVSAYLEDEHGIDLVCPLGFENTYALAMREDRARALGVSRIGDLAPHAPELSVGGDYELFDRPEWRAIDDAYHLDFAEQRAMDPALMYQAVHEGDIDVVGAYSTDGRVAAFDLRVLEDDRGAIPPYDAIILASPELARDHPEVVEALAPLCGAVDDETMRRLNMEVDARGKTPARVAEEYLAGLRDDDARE